jgi:quinol monooxygenase YgiN
MTFIPEKVEEFQALFHDTKEHIRNFEGVQKLELYRDKHQDNIFFTYSVWDDLHHLDLYRRSELFKNVWSETRLKFREKAEAWSVDKLVSL